MLSMDQLQQHEEEPCVPPGFRFHPTEEELVGYYLARKVASQKIDLDIIQEVDLYRIEPWDLQEMCNRGGGVAEDGLSSEWYFFSFKDRKYPGGTRTNRATAAGFWKATGRDKPVMSPTRGGVIGMRKTLVFYIGRAPNGRKTDWIIHEYRLQSNENAPAQEEGWVVCRAFQKPVPNRRPFVLPAYAASPSYYDGARLHIHGHAHGHVDDLHYLHHVAGGVVGGFVYPADQYCSAEELESKKNLFNNVPQLIDSPPLITSTGPVVVGCGDATGYDVVLHGEGTAANAMDWNFLDSLLSTSQLHDSSAVFASHVHLR